MRLMKMTELQVTRTTAGSGYIDPNTRAWTNGSSTTTFAAKGSLQPFASGKKQYVLPQGIKTSEAYNFFTSDKLYTTDDALDQVADTVVIDGVIFEVFDQEDWSHFNLKTAHYRAILIRKDKL